MSVADSDATETGETGPGDDSASAVEPTGEPVAPEPRRVSVSVRGLVIGAVIAVLAGATALLGWLYIDAKRELDANARETSNRERAETVAIEYAVNAANMDYQDFAGWKANLVNGTSPELKNKLTKAADSMEQVLAPLQWKSSARPLAAKVRSSSGGVYTVDAFVSVLTKTLQAPEGLQSTATYNVTLDSRSGWQITDVGGVDAALGR